MSRVNLNGNVLQFRKTTYSYLWCVARFRIICTIQNVKNTHGGMLILKPATLLKLTLLHRRFSRFWNCTNSTKSRNAAHLIIKHKHNLEMSYDNWIQLNLSSILVVFEMCYCFVSKQCLTRVARCLLAFCIASIWVWCGRLMDSDEMISLKRSFFWHLFKRI